MADSIMNDQEKQVKKVKRKLEPWRVLILPLNSVLLWEQQWYPGLIFGGISVMYLIIWMLDPSILTLLSTAGILINIIDFSVPTITANLYTPSAWTGQKEKLFEDICRTLVMDYNRASCMISNFYSKRESSPKLYYTLSIGVLLILAWFGSTINNAFLCYLVTLSLFMWPGLQYRGLPKHCFDSVFSLVSGAIKGREKTE